MERNFVIRTIGRLKKIIRKSIDNNNREKAMAAISASALIQYTYNQWYADEELEQSIKEIGEALPVSTLTKACLDENTILFYDGFGLDMRGLALIYLKAMAGLDYKLVYITNEKAKNSQAEIHKALEGYNCIWVYLNEKKGYVNYLSKLIEALELYRPHHAFLYTFPSDAAGVTAFGHYSGIINRFLINLTDHAFWIGKYAFDYCIEFRDYGASITNKYRGIEKQKIIKLPFYPYVDYGIPFEGFPFPIESSKVLYSGGPLYKTLGGDGEYYQIVDRILRKYKEIIFYYSGDGNTSELEKLKAAFPGRVWYSAERKDLYQVMKNSTLYLNTYPMVGGLMMQYAAKAGVVPLTLKRKGASDSDGLLINQNKLNIEFYDMNDLLNETDHLLRDTAYMEKKKKLLMNCVISEKEFQKELGRILTYNKSDFAVTYKDINTSQFLMDFAKRFKDIDCCNAIAKKMNRSLFFDFPMMFIQKVFRKAAGPNYAGN